MLEFRRLGSVDYLEAWDLQRQVHDDVVATGEGVVLFLEHPPVYTAGRRTEDHERPVDGTPVVDVDRGGKITWHGPGQLVAYPIVTLPQSSDDQPGIGVVDYVRRLEEAMIRMMAGYGIATGRVPGRSGVWLSPDPQRGLPERKIAQIGIRVSHNTTMHGLAINVAPDMGDFGKIVPCGIADAGVTSMAMELGDAAPTVDEVADALQPQLAEMLGWQPYEPSPDLTHDQAPTEGVTYGLTV
ncbi:lipoyl(octanoyl) transferase LipB [Mariniluteicoccus endophyticus]